MVIFNYVYLYSKLELREFKTLNLRTNNLVLEPLSAVLFWRNWRGKNKYVETPFDCKFLKIGSVSVRGIIKNFPFLQVCWPAPAPPTPPSKGDRPKTLFQYSMCKLTVAPPRIMYTFSFVYPRLAWVPIIKLLLSNSRLRLFHWGEKNTADDNIYHSTASSTTKWDLN